MRTIWLILLLVCMVGVSEGGILQNATVGSFLDLSDDDPVLEAGVFVSALKYKFLSLDVGLIGDGESVEPLTGISIDIKPAVEYVGIDYLLPENIGVGVFCNYSLDDDRIGYGLYVGLDF